MRCRALLIVAACGVAAGCGAAACGAGASSVPVSVSAPAVAAAAGRTPGGPPSAASAGSAGSSRSAVVPGGHGYTVLSYADGSGCVVAQLWTVHDMGHYRSGGSADPASARYSDSRGPSAAAASWAFFSG